MSSGRGCPPVLPVSSKVAWSTVETAASSRTWGYRTTEIVHNPLVGQRCGNVRSLQCLHIESHKSLGSGCRCNSRTTKILPADWRCYMGNRNPEEKDWFVNPFERSVEYSRGARASSFYNACKKHMQSIVPGHPRKWNETKNTAITTLFRLSFQKNTNGSLRSDLDFLPVLSGSTGFCKYCANEIQ